MHHFGPDPVAKTCITCHLTPLRRVATSDHALAALIAAAPEVGGPGFLLPASNGEIARWALGHGFRVVQAMTLMTLGLYNESRGAYLPSILY